MLFQQSRRNTAVADSKKRKFTDHCYQTDLSTLGSKTTHFCWSPTLHPLDPILFPLKSSDESTQL